MSQVLNDLTGRLDRLESENQRLARFNRAQRRALAGCLLLCAVLALTGAQSSGGPKSVRTDELSLVDKDGKCRAELRVKQDGTDSLSLTDSRERCQLTLN